MSSRGFLVQCDRSEPTYYGGQPMYECNATARLLKPAKWRCDACTKRWGPLPKEHRP